MTLWLWGYEVIDTVLVFTETKLWVVTSASKAKVLQPISEAVAPDDGEPTVEFVVRPRGQDADAERAQLRSVLDHTKESFDGKCVGALLKGLRHETGPLIEAWKQVTEKADYTLTEIGKALARLLAVKDDSEQKMMRTAASITQAVMKNFFVTKLEEVIDHEKKVTHQEIAEYIDNLLSDPRKISRKLSAETVDACYAPIVQSGGDYDLRPSARSKNTTIHFGTIVCSVGSRYKSYCSNVARTLFVNPTDDQKNVYAGREDMCVCVCCVRSVYVYVYVCMCVCVYVCMCVRRWMYTGGCTQVYGYV
jgi:FACT complex subunit SPT16